MDDMKKRIDIIEQTVVQEQVERYGKGVSKEQILDMQDYKSLPITTASNPGEVGLVLEDVILLRKIKTLANKEKIPVYELFGENGVKILETQDDGLMKFDKEIFEELIKDKIKAIQTAGYDVAGIDVDGNLDSFFEMINGKVIAINREQKERLDRGSDKEALRESIDGETADPEIETSEDRVDEQEQMQKMQTEQQAQEQVSKELGVDVHQITKVDDPIFRMNNPQTRGKDLYVVLTHNDEVKFVNMEDGVPKEAEGFKNSGKASGRTTKIVHDQDMLNDNEVNTYGEIYPTGHDNMRYTIEKGQYGEIKLVEQIRYDGNKMSETDKWISREVESSNTNYLDINREGAENSDNITARTFNQASQNTDANKYGHSNNKGGLSEVGDTMKDKPNDTNLESLASDTNNRIDAARKMVDDNMKNGASLDPDTEAFINKKITDMIDANIVIDNDSAQQIANEAILFQRAQQNADNNKKQEEQDGNEQSNDRDRLSEAHGNSRRPY